MPPVCSCRRASRDLERAHELLCRTRDVGTARVRGKGHRDHIDEAGEHRTPCRESGLAKLECDKVRLAECSDGFGREAALDRGRSGLSRVAHRNDFEE